MTEIMEGKIIVGFPGVGKSTLASKLHNVIDLESSYFHNSNEGTSWVKGYCDIAIKLYKKGNIVFVSSHDAVRYELAETGVENKLLVFPSLELKEQWIDKLQHRFDTTQSEKDKRALSYVSENYDDCVVSMMYDNNFDHVVISDINYDLASLLKL